MITTFGERMRSLMTKRGLSLRKLAATVHYDLGYLSKVSRDLKPPSNAMARALDEALAADGELIALAPVRSRLWRPAGIITSEDEERLTLAVERPVSVDQNVLDALATVLAGQRRLEDAIGPAALAIPIGAQLAQLTVMLRETTGPQRERFGRIVAEWTCYVGWLYAAVREDAQAYNYLGRAEELADEFGDGTIAAIATSFRGYPARQQGRHRAVVRASSAALATPGGHPSQRIFDLLQAALGYAALGEREHARGLLDDAANRAADAPEPPPAIYWYTPSFFQLYTGMVLGHLGEYRDAADLLRAGIAGVPADQRGAEWMREYEDALTFAQDRA